MYATLYFGRTVDMKTATTASFQQQKPSTDFAHQYIIHVFFIYIYKLKQILKGFLKEFRKIPGDIL